MSTIEFPALVIPRSVSSCSSVHGFSSSRYLLCLTDAMDRPRIAASSNVLRPSFRPVLKVCKSASVQTLRSARMICARITLPCLLYLLTPPGPTAAARRESICAFGLASLRMRSSICSRLKPSLIPLRAISISASVHGEGPPAYCLTVAENCTDCCLRAVHGYTFQCVSLDRSCTFTKGTDQIGLCRINCNSGHTMMSQEPGA